MKGNKNKISNKYTKIMLLALLIIASILSMYLVTNTNNKVFNANVINQKADTREIVNIPDQDLKNFLLTNLKKPQSERRDNITNNDTLTLSDSNYIKPSDENEIYKYEMEKILGIEARGINTKETALDLTGLEKAINLTKLGLAFNKIENVEPLKDLVNLTSLDLIDNRIKNLEYLKNLKKITDLSITEQKLEIKPDTNKFNLPELKDYNGDLIDLVQASNGLLKKNEDGTYSLTTKTKDFVYINDDKRGILYSSLQGYSLYIIKIDPTNIPDTREIVNIPNEDLKNFLLTYFKKTPSERGYSFQLNDANYVKPSTENEIYKDEMEKIIMLNAINVNTKETAMDLTGLEKAINLTTLDLSSNKIENIEPLKGLTNLSYLYLNNNKIENIEPLRGLTKLIQLYLNNNKIENIEPLRGLTNLTSLLLGVNKIENVEPLRGLTNLTILGLSSNKIENIEPLKGLTNLKGLYLNDNKIENIESLRGLTNLTELYLENNKIENIEPLKGLTKLIQLYLNINKIENIEPLKELTNLILLDLDINKIENIEPLKELTNLKWLNLSTEIIRVSPNTNKFNLPELKEYNGDLIDLVQASNGLLKKNTDGTYSFTRKVTGVQTVNVGKGIWNRDPKVDTNWNIGNPLYILKIDSTNIPDEKISITKTIKDMSNTLLNNDKETKVVPVIKRNGQVITNTNTNNVGHRANNEELLTYTWNELPKFDDTYTDYNYEVTFDISGLPEGYSIVPNTKTADNQADFNITYVSPKVTVTKDITVNRWR